MLDQLVLKHRLTHIIGIPTGSDMLHDPALNKGTAFSEEERDALRLRGLLPPRVFSQEQQMQRVLENIRRKESGLEKYIYLIALQERNESLFYRVLLENLEELTPHIYTPTVGQACLEYGHILRRSRGLFISAQDRGRVREVLSNWPYDDVRVIVVTDGERILGLGDLGANGMGIPVGKLSLYTACGGIHPAYCLPITLDVGTNNEELLEDPLYIGLQQRRLRGPAYDELIDEFFAAVQERYPGALIQLEDFGNSNAFRLLQRYRDTACTFDDDIQGTAAVALAGIYAAGRLSGLTLQQQRFLFLGAGEAGIGIGDLIVAALVDEGMALEEARRHCWFIDSKGLVVSGRDDLAAHKRPYAHDHPYIGDFLAAIEALLPTAIIGVSAQPSTFTRPVVEALARLNERPLVFALSNPNSKAECTAEEAYVWSEGRAIFAGGSPWPPVVYAGRTLLPGQGNNAYIFPGIGLGVLACGARRITDEMFLAAARTVARLTSDEDLAQGRVYPPFAGIRAVSAAIAEAVAEIAYARGLASRPFPGDLGALIRELMYDPAYKSYL